MRKDAGFLLLAVLATAGCRWWRAPEPQPLVWEAAAEETVVRALEDARAAGEAIDDCACRFYRHERVGDFLGTKQRMDVKFRPRPFSLYMRWVDPAKVGAEFLYVAGEYDDKAFVRQGGAFGWLLPTMRLGLADPLIVKHSRHAVTDFGLAAVAGTVLESARRAREAGALRARALPAGDVHGEPARGFELLLPDRPDFYARRVTVWFDSETGLLKRVVAHNAAGDLLEDYAFTQVRVNVGLTDADFDPHNPAYRF